MKTIIGIDPGLKGGIAIWKDEKIVYAEKMPLAGNDIDLVYIKQDVEDYFDGMALCVIEKVHSMPKQGVASTFKFGVGFGKLIGLFSAIGFPIHLVPPQTWKKRILSGTKKDKDAAIDYVRRRYPDVDLTPGRTRKCHDGIADAVCLAEFGRYL